MLHLGPLPDRDGEPGSPPRGGTVNWAGTQSGQQNREPDRVKVNGGGPRWSKVKSIVTDPRSAQRRPRQGGHPRLEDRICGNLSFSWKGPAVEHPGASDHTQPGGDPRIFMREMRGVDPGPDRHPGRAHRGGPDEPARAYCRRGSGTAARHSAIAKRARCACWSRREPDGITCRNADHVMGIEEAWLPPGVPWTCLCSSAPVVAGSGDEPYTRCGPG